MTTPIIKQLQENGVHPRNIHMEDFSILTYPKNAWEQRVLEALKKLFK
jgi:hypothetical protein